MNWKKGGLKALLLLLAIVVGFLAGLLPGIPAGEGQMLAAGAIVLGYGLFGAFLALVLCVLFSRGCTERQLSVGILGLALIGIVLFFFVRDAVEESRKRRDERRNAYPQETYQIERDEPEDHRITSAIDRLPDRSQLPVNTKMTGLGFVRVPFDRDGLRLLWNATPGFDAPAVDSLVYQLNDGRYQLLYAPPYMGPYRLKPDYQLLYLRALSVNRFSVEVALNEDLSRRGWVSRETVEWLPWPAFLLEQEIVEPIDKEAGPYLRPTEGADKVLLRSGQVIRINSIGSEWAAVTVGPEAGNNEDANAWIKWRKGDQFLVKW